MMSQEKHDEEQDDIGNIDPMVEVTFEDRILERPLTDQERLACGEELAIEQEKAEQAEDKKKALVKEYDGVIQGAYTKVSALSAKLRHGKIQDKVQCRVIKDYRLGWLRVIRLDDNTEASSRPLTTEEMQLGLGFQEGK